ncbi:hypothetical protein SAMN04487792_0577 [Lactobacillus bombicola]|jgi:hypothetical protein|uniref:Uncharacterized protein n=1 Tax=Lactobacillus bombicola TaxID=1505723 RepID=A0A1I1RZI8_9LACO|nr:MULTISPECIES: hypothetical protein [Lactobacillus]MCO6527431.1 hypothetical protein [Lactobacillus sp.]RHW50828.1 hypothetical protein DS834_06010 [Lactobacillus bombicola]RHW51678.1 hypothetical protein DS833_02495 [Lactobacillus bombicola]RHW54895.1 hypothetical protein DS835_01935 [Lactobacillus bombicola]RMC40240.1 hypothetical protein F5ESL0233_07395 [Lactobacillus sp. ESL0233]
MEKLAIVALADDLAMNQESILNQEIDFDAEAVYRVIDSLQVLHKPVKEYFAMTQEQYYETESDHKLTLINLSANLTDLHDRILTNHVDGFVDQHEINLTYNHENPFEDDFYNNVVDFHVVSYSLKVIGAVQAVAAQELQTVLSKDAVLSIGLAAYALANNK